MSQEIFDVAVIGAGVAGLICARQLDRAGYRVVVSEKSRGVGGRLATRRIAGTRADLGAPYVEAEGRLSGLLFENMSDRQILQSWTETVWQWNPSGEAQPEPPKPRYIAPAGMSAVGKFLATDLEIWFDRRVCRIARSQDKIWHLSLDSPRHSADFPLELMAKSIVVAIPAPQAVAILETLGDVSSELLEPLQRVEYDPSFVAIAGYPVHNRARLEELDRPWRAIRFPQHDELSWLGLDSSKRSDASQPIFVLHSSARFARHYLESEDLEQLGKQLLDRVASLLEPALATPEFLQVHRWRYAFPHRVYSQDCLTADLPSPLVCCGDWCGEKRIETGLRSGLAAASAIDSQLQQRSLLSAIDLLETIVQN
ncbi:MAG: FAD-dependent oxidoreductase [Geitlerinemataceae cyanobacterium]